MRIEDVRVVGGPLVVAMPEEVDALAAQLWITFPAGYREYVTRLGEGEVGGVRIYPPWRIERDLTQWRQRIKQYWFWEQGRSRELLPKDRALECVVIGDNDNGDELVFHPCRPQHLFILPRDDEAIVEAGADLLTAIDTLRSGDPLAELTFEPWDTRRPGSRIPAPGTADDPPGQSLDDIVALAEEWANRHAVKSVAQAQLRQQTPEDAEAAQLYEGILFGGPAGIVGYRIAWRIVNKETGNLLGQIYWHYTEGSYGGGWDMDTSPTRKYD